VYRTGRHRAAEGQPRDERQVNAHDDRRRESARTAPFPALVAVLGFANLIDGGGALIAARWTQPPGALGLGVRSGCGELAPAPFRASSIRLVAADGEMKLSGCNVAADRGITAASLVRVAAPVMVSGDRGGPRRGAIDVPLHPQSATR
jgi:hypothetical protein